MLPRLTRNLAFLYGAEALGKLLALLVFGHLGRALLESRYGDLEFAIAIVFLLNLVMEAGLAPYAAREAAKRPEITPTLAGQITVLRVGILAVSLLVLAAASATLDRDWIARTLLIAYGLVLLPGPLLLNWAFQARDEMNVVAGCALGRQVVLAIGVLTLVREPSDVLWVPVCDALGFAGAVLVQQVVFRRRVGAWHLRGAVDGCARLAREAVPFALFSIAWAVRITAPIIALGVLTTSADTGVFAAGHRLVIALHAFVGLYHFNLLPTVSRLSMNESREPYRQLMRRSGHIVAWVTVFGAVLGTVLAPELVSLVYGAGLAQAAGPFAVLVWLLVPAAIGGHHRASLTAFGYQGTNLVAMSGGFAVVVGGCLAYGVSLTPMRAAWILVASEVVVYLLGDLLLARRVERLRYAGVLLGPSITAVAALAVFIGLEATPQLPRLALTVVTLLAGLVLLEPRARAFVRAWMAARRRGI